MHLTGQPNTLDSARLDVLPAELNGCFARACHHSSGSCSDHNGLGVERVCERKQRQLHYRRYRSKVLYYRSRNITSQKNIHHSCFRSMILSISSYCSRVSGPNSRERLFSSTWAVVRNPGMGTVFSLRAHSQPIAPCARVRPSCVKISRTDCNFARYSGFGFPSLKYFIQAGEFIPRHRQSRVCVGLVFAVRRPMARGPG